MSYKSGQKSTAVNDFFDQQDSTTVTPMEEVCEPQEEPFWSAYELFSIHSRWLLIL